MEKMKEDLRKLNVQLFRNRFQGPHESVQSYAMKLRKLANKAFNDMTEAGQIQLVDDQFWVGIHDCIRHALAISECVGFEASL